MLLQVRFITLANYYSWVRKLLKAPHTGLSVALSIIPLHSNTLWGPINQNVEDERLANDRQQPEDILALSYIVYNPGHLLTLGKV